MKNLGVLWMRYIKFDEYYKKRATFTEKRLLIKNKRLRKSRIKGKEEWEILFKLAMNRYKKILETKEIEKIGDRKWRLRL